MISLCMKHLLVFFFKEFIIKEILNVCQEEKLLLSYM